MFSKITNNKLTGKNCTFVTLISPEEVTFQCIRSHCIISDMLL